MSSSESIKIDGFDMKIGNCYILTNESQELGPADKYGIRPKKTVFKKVEKTRNPDNYLIRVSHITTSDPATKFEVAGKLEQIVEIPIITRDEEGEHHSIRRSLIFRLDNHECNKLPYALKGTLPRIWKAADEAEDSVVAKGGTKEEIRQARRDASEKAYAELQDASKAEDLSLGKINKFIHTFMDDDFDTSRIKIVKEISCDELNDRFGLFSGGKRKNKTKRARRNRRRSSRRN
jgi:hypothetical protein